MEIPAVDLAKPSEDPPIIMSLSDLLSTLDVIASHEASDIQLIQTLTTVNETDLRNRLIAWGMRGFPSGYVLYSLQFSHLERCSDGVVRNDVLEYFNFLSPTTTIAGVLSDIESKLPGMSLSYSYTNDFVVSIHVTRK